jgi:3-oxoadipate enol-lactonase
MELQICEVPQGYLAFEVRGKGLPIVLIHGFTFDMRTWDAQVDVLSQTFQVIRYDLRGFGRSSLPRGRYSHVEDLQALIQFLSLSAPVLIGLSLGANIALTYALANPGTVRALILASPGLPGFAWSEDRPPEAAAAIAKSHGVEAARRFWLDHQLFASLRRSPSAFARVCRMVQDYSGWHWRGENHTTQASFVNHLSECASPTLVMSGCLDVSGYRQIATKLSRDIPGAVLLAFANAGHVLNEEDPAGFSTAVLDFVRRIPVASPTVIQ